MTKTTEELKREMYLRFGIVKDLAEDAGASPCISVREFEDSLEAYLEALRKAMVTINESTVSCAQHSAEAFVDLETRLDRMTEERDTLRNKLQAFEFANRSAAELLSEALREPSGLRKPESCALARRTQENASFDIPEALLRCPAHFIQTNCKEGRHFMVNSSGPDGGVHCLACGHHREIPR